MQKQKNGRYFSCEGWQIHCPTTSDCNNCVINCLDAVACRASEIFSYSCKNVTINCEGTGSEGIVQDATIYAPDSFGNLTLNTIEGKCFRRAEIISSDKGTGSIQINCNDNSYNSEWYVQTISC